MTHYKLRVTPSKSLNPNTCLESIENEILTKCEHFAYVFEGDGEKIEKHLHYYLFISQIDDKQLRYQLRKILGTGGRKGNSVFSLSRLEISADNQPSGFPLEYLAYMLKNNPTLYTSDSFPSDVIRSAKEISDRVSEKRAKSQPKSVIRRLEQKFVEQYIDHKQEINSVVTLQFVISFFKTEELPVRENQIISLTQTLLLKYSNSYEEELFQKLLSKI